MKRLLFIVSYAFALALGSTPAVAQTSFEQAVADRGYNENVQDLSESMNIKVAEPDLAFVNLVGFTGMPTYKSDKRKGYIEVYDGNGHYFRKPVVIQAQGAYSLRFPKKNFSCQFTDEQWNEDGAPELKFGNWVKQDGFHFKAFYTDYTRGLGECGYKLFSQMVADRAPYWERGGYYESSAARCFPDAFPCAVYLNGNFHGIYAWQLKKHRKNMNQKKALATHIHLDGNLNDSYIFRGYIYWSQFEIRTPKVLYDKLGKVYDGDDPNELIDEGSAFYYSTDDTDSIRAIKQRSAEVKQCIETLGNYWNDLHSFEMIGTSAELIRQEVEQRFDIEALIDYAVHYHFTRNGDGSLKNWQWFTYDGKRWTVTPYDLDQTFGIGLYGNIEPPYRPLEKLTSGPFYWIDKYFADDMADRYAALRQSGVLAYDNVMAIIDNWRSRIGEQLYAMEEARWPQSPCYSDAQCNEGWEALPLDAPEYYLSGLSSYSAKREYHAGDVCWLEGRLWRATDTVKGVKPFIVNSNRDSVERISWWLEGRIAFLDAYFAYDPNSTNAETAPCEPSAGKRRLLGIYTLSGMKVDTPLTGQTYIFRYTDGTSRKAMAR